MRKSTFPRKPGWLLALTLALLGSAGARAQQVAAPALQEAAAYGLLSGADLVAGTSDGQPSSIRVQGWAGATGTISPGVQASAGREEQGDGNVPNALASAQKAQAYCTSLGGSSLSGQLKGQVLGAGAYQVAGDALLDGGATLTLSGDTATVIVLNITGSLEFGAQARVVLAGVLPQHVFWNVAGGLAVASDVSFSGVALTGGSIAFTGVHAGRCALLSQQGIVLTDIPSMIGHNWFYASARLTTTCTPQTCTFTPPSGELVYDGSFELYSCPPTELGGSSPCYWHTPTMGSPDFFHADADATSHVQVPDNIAGIRHRIDPPNPLDTQLHIYALGQNTTAATGRGYAGLYAYGPTLIYDQNTGTSSTVYHNEYVAQEIAASLQTTHRYYGEFSARLAPASGNRVEHLAMAVAPSGYTSPNAILTAASPGIELAVVGTLDASQNPSASAIANQTGLWNRLGKVFTLNSARTNSFTLVIGNFENAHVAGGPTANASSIPTIGPNPGDEEYYEHRHELANGAYYYIDNVTLSMVTEAGTSPSVTLLVPPCAGGPGSGPGGSSSVTLGTLPMPAMVGATYSWTSSNSNFTSSLANPTVSPTQTTTYTLTVSIPVPTSVVNGVQQTQTQSFTSTVTVNVASYGQTAGATYVNPVTSGAAYEIGAAGTTTTLDGGGGTVTFAGRYHVLGNVRLTNGTFSLKPGTVFYVDGQASRQPLAGNVDDRTVQGATITLGDGAWLLLDGATITASGCGPSSPMWRGIVVEGNVPVGSSAQVDIRNGSVISHAYCALTVTRGNITALGVPYSLTGSAFQHNLTHVLDMGTRKGAGGPALIQNCTFDSNPAQMRYPYNATQATDRYVTYQALQLLPYSDANADAVQVTDNTINHAVYGIVNNVTGGNQTNVLIAGNTLNNIYQTGIWAADNQAQPQGSNTVPTISDNVIHLSGFGGQVTEQLSADATLLGLTTENSQPLYQRSALRGNSVYGDAASSKPQLGLSLYYQTDARSNTLYDLREGISTTALDGSRVVDNATYRCQAGVTVQPSGSYGYQAQIGCNSFYRSGTSGVLRGIWAVDQAEFNDQGTFANPAGNAFWQFSTQDEKVSNDGTAPINYYRTASLSEDVPVQIAGSRSGTAIKNTQISDGYCSATGSYDNGVRGTLPGLSYIALVADTVRRQLVPRPRRRQYLSLVLHHYLEQGQAATLQAWWATLLPLNAEDYRTTGLWLLHYYDQSPATALAAERVLTALRPQAALDANLAAELSLRQVERHLPATAPRLAAADSVVLRAVAWSGTVGAGRAGRWLRYFHPRLDVPATTTSPDPLRPAARPVAAPPVQPALTAQLGEAYPNPAHTEVQIACQLPVGATSGVLRLTDLMTGRTVREVPVPADEQARPLRVSLNGLAPGTYAYRLLVDGRAVAGARKLVVIP